MTHRLLAWSLLAAAVIAVYAPGLRGPFVFDDHPNLTANGRVQIADLSPASLRQAAFSSTSGPLMRPISMVSFGVNYGLTGDDVFYFKLTNLLIHLVNALLVGGLVWRIASRTPGFSSLPVSPASLGLAVTALWALHPIQLTSVLYVVQRMTELSALFMLIALHCYVDGRARLDDGRPRGWLGIAAALAVWTPLAVLAKENGVLVLAYAWVIELFAFQNAATEAAQRRRRRLFGALSIAGVLGAGLLLDMRGLPLTEPFGGKTFSALDQIHTAPRVLLWYLQMLVAPDIHQMGLVHDDWRISTGLLSPPQTLAAILFWAFALAGGLYLRRSAPWFGFGVWWFIAGHSLEAAPIGLDLIYEHRNYLPAAGPLLGLTAAVAIAADRYRVRRTFLAASLAVAVAALSLLTAMRVHEWRDITRWAHAQFNNHPDSSASAYFLGGLYATLAELEPPGPAREELFAEADGLFARSAALSPAEAHAAIARIVLHQSLGKDAPDAVYREVAARLSHGRLDASAQTAVMTLIHCNTRKTCSLPEDKLLLVVNAALDNPLCPGFFSSRLLMSLADYYGDARGDARKAITYAKAATEMSSADIASWFTLIRWLARTGYLKQAMEAMDQLDLRDRNNALAQPRAQMRAELDKLAQSAGSPVNP